MRDDFNKENSYTMNFRSVTWLNRTDLCSRPKLN